MSKIVDQIFDESVRDNSVLFENIARPIIDATLNGFNGIEYYLLRLMVSKEPYSPMVKHLPVKPIP